ncbi:MAG TPA: hypothetical protein VLA72_22630 [Anaerolineales bacterium]|nr:hypothetical protein [Anaerolineales bacterium]
MKTYGHFINGEEIISHRTFEDLNPFTDEFYAFASRGNVDDVKKAVSAARTGF